MAYIGQPFSPTIVGSNLIADSSIIESKIANLAVTVSKIAANAVTSAKIEEGTIITGDMADNAITTAKIAESAITSARLASGLTLAGTTTLTSAVLSNTITTARINEGIVELGNTHTNPNINLFLGTVFRATLNANATFTIQNASAVSSNVSSFTLILTNDNVAGRSVAWAGGNFRFPGGSSSLARTTGASNTDVWFFFTPDKGTTFFGSQPMKDLLA